MNAFLPKLMLWSSDHVVSAGERLNLVDRIARLAQRRIGAVTQGNRRGVRRGGRAFGLVAADARATFAAPHVVEGRFMH